ncbi:succinoglycan biosynthesis protein ExoW [Pseudorhizobium tarimense]|uniref:Succinoglycan biosynthesis protein ExoW n=1 Tax=Pseudorhizobium tarimense TaxID=1079109 RepID=A0ABV2H0T0_9HYPH|nr:glycosyltransferase family A protein [Pseudorhizobium tarimense]MCJ8517473.1 glycosyltransferase family 2 protein [Pseudorhizobium tarimense]
MATFTVIIPFYQREAGILRRALDSIFSQTLQDFDVLVVDDESPVPAENELEPLDANARSRITVLKQANAGPGGARNTGLDNVPASTRLVAFLDSDDLWLPDHLNNAQEFMTRFDGDCYWDSMQASSEFYYHFGMAELEAKEGGKRLSDAPLVIEMPDLASVMLKNWSFLHLSCMVLGRDLFEKIRFDAALRLAAEDVLFFCDCIMASKRTLLCDEAGAVRGLGLNIFHSIDNQSPQFLRQQFNTWEALDRLEQRFSRRPEDVASITLYKDRARQQALWSQAGRVRKRAAPDIGLLARWAWRDPRLLRTLVELGAGKFPRTNRQSSP